MQCVIPEEILWISLRKCLSLSNTVRIHRNEFQEIVDSVYFYSGDYFPGWSRYNNILRPVLYLREYSQQHK